MLITALAKSSEQDRVELERWISLDDFVADEKIKAVTSIYNKVGVPEVCMEKINELYTEGLQILEKVSVDDALKNILRNFTGKLTNRVL